jgi:hypothetical protein
VRVCWSCAKQLDTHLKIDTMIIQASEQKAEQTGGKDLTSESSQLCTIVRRSQASAQKPLFASSLLTVLHVATCSSIYSYM